MCSTRPFVSSDFLLPLHLVRLLGGCLCKYRMWSLLCCTLVTEITCEVLLTCLYFVYCQAAQGVPNFLTQFVPENIDNMYDSQATDLYVGTGVLFHLHERYLNTPIYGQQT